MLEMNYVRCGDSAELLKQLPSDCIDLVVTSPPYDNLRRYNGYSFDFETIAEQLYRVLKQGGVIVWIVNDSTVNGSETCTSFKQAIYFRDIGLNLHDTMIWVKDSGSLPDATRYYQNFEYMFVFSNGKPKTVNLISDRRNKWYGTKVHGTYRTTNGDTVRRSESLTNTICGEFGNRFNVWDVPSEKNNRTGHPAVFPSKLAHDHIITWSNSGDLVLDPFLGSGTTAIEAKLLHRNYIGFDVSEEYCNIAKSRLDSTYPNYNLFE